MGRELRRVPLDFNWPLHEVWSGYLATEKQKATLARMSEARQEAWWERFVPVGPPVGEGYQLWETTTEGSPISPVFATLEALCEYAAEHCSTFADFTATAEEWRKMLDSGLVGHRSGNVMFC